MVNLLSLKIEQGSNNFLCPEPVRYSGHSGLQSANKDRTSHRSRKKKKAKTEKHSKRNQKECIIATFVTMTLQKTQTKASKGYVVD